MMFSTHPYTIKDIKDRNHHFSILMNSLFVFYKMLWIFILIFILFFILSVVKTSLYNQDF